ncbi:MAG: cytochrome c [Aggregatilineales bacterium]
MEPKTAKSKLPLLVTGALLAVISIGFVYEFVLTSTTTPEGAAEVLTSNTYMDIVAPLLAAADVERGAALVNSQFECHVCHVQSAGQVAPGFDGIGARAATARPPLTAEAYLYESIMYPSVHVVGGYSASMPANYPTRLEPQQVGDMIAYLLTR